ncbi:unnamed protein product, partial [Timema podura]|nr:unnamed protein product [Timema podura]
LLITKHSTPSPPCWSQQAKLCSKPVGFSSDQSPVSSLHLTWLPLGFHQPSIRFLRPRGTPLGGEIRVDKLKSFSSPEEVSRRNTEERAMREKLEKRLVLEREKRAKEAQEKRIQEERERIAHIEHEKRVGEEQVRRVQAERERILQEECERRIQEERERRVQEEKEKERRRQAALTATADTIFNQLFLELTRDVCWKVLTVEQMLVWTSETCNTIIQEVLEDYLCQIAREILLQERLSKEDLMKKGHQGVPIVTNAAETVTAETVNVRETREVEAMGMKFVRS